MEEVAKAVGGGYCRLQMPLSLAPAVRGTVAGHRLGALEGGGSPPFQCIPAQAPPLPPAVATARPAFTVSCGTPQKEGWTFTDCQETQGGSCTAACAAGYSGDDVAVTCNADKTWTYSGTCAPGMRVRGGDVFLCLERARDVARSARHRPRSAVRASGSHGAPLKHASHPSFPCYSTQQVGLG